MSFIIIYWVSFANPAVISDIMRLEFGSNIVVNDGGHAGEDGKM